MTMTTEEQKRLRNLERMVLGLLGILADHNNMSQDEISTLADNMGLAFHHSLNSFVGGITPDLETNDNDN